MTPPDLLHMQAGALEAQQQALLKLLSASMHADDISCSERWPQLLQGLSACCSTPGCADAAAQLVAKLAPHLMRQSPEQSAELLLAIRLYLCSKMVELDAEGERLHAVTAAAPALGNRNAGVCARDATRMHQQERLPSYMGT
jgi:hypothetical protein